MAAACSVIVPAYNEEATIGRLLTALLDGNENLEICVVCNGCSDRTAEIARGFAPRVRVFEQHHPSKTDALNLGIERSTASIKIMVDADTVIGGKDVTHLARLTEAPGVLVVQPQLVYDTVPCSRAVRAYFAIWRQHPYVATKVGAVYALSPAGVAKLGRLPSVTADDEYVRRKLFHGAIWTESVKVAVHPPRTLNALIRTRARSLSGARSIMLGGMPPPVAQGGVRNVLLRSLTSRQAPAALVYVYVALAARLRAKSTAGRVRWERDETSRTFERMASTAP